MAVACEGIERDVAEYAEIGKFLLDGAHRLADEIVGIERFRSVFVTQGRIGVGKQRYTGDIELYRALGVAHGLIDRQPVDARHRRDGYALVVAVSNEQRPDQVVRGE